MPRDPYRHVLGLAWPLRTSSTLHVAATGARRPASCTQRSSATRRPRPCRKRKFTRRPIALGSVVVERRVEVRGVGVDDRVLAR
jgi:hypothetical protein